MINTAMKYLKAQNLSLLNGGLKFSIPINKFSLFLLDVFLSSYKIPRISILSLIGILLGMFLETLPFL